MRARWSPSWGRERRGQVHADENFKRCLRGWRDIVLDGRPFPNSIHLEARGFGVAIIYQELSLMSEMNVMENVYVSHEPRKVGNLIDFRKMYADTKEQLAKLNAGHYLGAG